jgi:hypothetical protein
MSQAHHHADFAREPLHAYAVREFFAEEFDGDALAGVLVSREINDCASAPTEFTLEFVPVGERLWIYGVAHCRSKPAPLSKERQRTGPSNATPVRVNGMPTGLSRLHNTAGHVKADAVTRFVAERVG